MNTVKNDTHTIDIEPLWIDVVKIYERITGKDLSVLYPACNIADVVRQAQKQGKNEVTFILNDDGTSTIKEG